MMAFVGLTGSFAALQQNWVKENLIEPTKNKNPPTLSRGTELTNPSLVN